MEKGPIEESISERDNLVEIILNVAFLSAGVNILVTSSSLLRIVVGIVLIAASVFFLIRSKILTIEENFRFESVLSYNNSENRIFEIPEYELSWTFKNNMEAAISENNDIKAIWNNRPISEQKFPERATSSKETTSMMLTEEMFEYILLSKLSTVSEDYFNGKFIEVEHYNRDEIPGILLENRFIELFSKPMKDRAAFQEQAPNANELDSPDHYKVGETIYATGKDGAKFEKFTLTLPKGCEISRDEKGRIVIDSNELTLRISATSVGYSTVLDYDVALLETETGFEDISLKQMHASIDLEIGYLSLFKDIGEEYKWVDKYIQRVEDEVSLEKYKDDLEIPQLKVAAKIAADEIQS
jgi:hypothetical protein